MGRIAEIASWWVVCVGVWLSTLAAITLDDVVLAVAGGGLAAVAASAGRRAETARWRFRSAWIRWLADLPVSVLLGSGRVLHDRLRHPRRCGRFETVRMPPEKCAQLAAGRRALASLAITISPDACVVDIDPDRSELLVHRLVPGPPKWTRVDPQRD